MPAAQARWAADTEVIRRLESEWQDPAHSPMVRQRLRDWASEDSRLAFETGADLVEAAQRREASSWEERDTILTALLDLYEDESLARRIALQIVLPQIKSLINRIRGWDVEERAARVVATTVDVLAHCAAESAGTSPSFRVFSNTRRRILRAATRDRTEPLVLTPNLSQLMASTTPQTARGDEEWKLDELIAWVRDHGPLPEDAARLVVLTRAWGVSVSELATLRGVSPQTMRRQRLRAEQRLRRGLFLAL